MATWENHLECICTDSVQSANKALDYYDGAQLYWLESLLDCEKQGIKDWRVRGVYPVYTNITKKIVDRSALTYNKAPARVVTVNGDPNDEGTEVYADMLSEGMFEATMDAADSVCRLLKNVIILAQVVEVADGTEKTLFSVLHRGNSDVDFNHKTGEIDTLIYQSCGCGPNGGKLFHFWNTDQILDIEVCDNQPRVIGKEDHGYGIIPAAVLWDTFKPRAGFWPKCAWQELVRLNEGVNLFHTEVKFNERFQAFGALFTNASIPTDSVIGPDSVIDELGQTSDGAAVFLEYRTPDINLEKFHAWLKDFESSVADNWGVNLSVDGGGSADSGFKLVVEEIWNLQTRNDRIKAAKQFEVDFYKVMLAISEARDFGLPSGSSLAVEFPPPSLPVNAKETWEITQGQIATNYLPIEEAWKRDNPDITEDEIAARKELIAQSKTGNVPRFGSVVDDGEQ